MNVVYVGIKKPDIIKSKADQYAINVLSVWKNLEVERWKIDKRNNDRITDRKWTLHNVRICQKARLDW